MRGKRKSNGHKERRGRQVFKRNISERVNDYPAFDREFGHLEGDTIVGEHHKSAVITLVERLSKVIITLKPMVVQLEILKLQLTLDVHKALQPVQIHYF